GLADTLSVAMSKDSVGAGTAADAAGATGWGQPVCGKTGTSEANRSSSFLGFTDKYAAAVYAFNDGTNTSELCSGPLRQRGNGNPFGGDEPARPRVAAMAPRAAAYAPIAPP